VNDLVQSIAVNLQTAGIPRHPERFQNYRQPEKEKAQQANELSN
jgi:3-deoxy-D-manno-octulosonic-acid transferase